MLKSLNKTVSDVSLTGCTTSLDQFQCGFTGCDTTECVFCDSRDGCASCDAEWCWFTDND